jgi:fluoride ion exporter CrcB/FEX
MSVLDTVQEHLVAVWAAQRFGTTFHYGTLIVNLTGCFAIAAIMHAAMTLAWSPHSSRRAAAAGSVGGLNASS